ncbi:leukocyte elastase inhibitor [Andrena cerasifolii]|uniref:leukocyte elastase inhibitor n=1 Tax=Andrena cerasifolii TaxID=2819439 RepID=UPI0040381E1A
MAIALVFLSLLACSCGQLIYPDAEILKSRTSTVYPLLYPSISRHQVSPQEQMPPYSPPRPQYPQAPPRQLEQRPPQNFPVPSLPIPTTTATTITQQQTVPAAAETEHPLQEWKDHVNDIIARGIWKLTLDMEREIYRTRNTSMSYQPDNIVFSPISLAVTLTLVLAGSAGRTFDEVSKVLGLEGGVDISRNSEIVHQMFGMLLNQLHNKIEGSPGPRIDFATAAFVQNGYPIRPEFKTISSNVYNNEVINADFARNGRATQEMVNAWVKQKTMGKITSILDQPPDPATTVILLSALYFKGEWNQYFVNAFTKRRPFYVEPNEPIEVDMMLTGGQFPFYEDKQLGVKILGLPYKGLETTMYVLLPTAQGARALRSFQSQLTVDVIEKLISNMKNTTCIIGLPRMKLSNSLTLKPTLASLGLSSLFDPATSDLSLVSQGSGKGNFFTDRFGEDSDAGQHVTRRNYFTYEDKLRGYTVKQWSTGFSIKRSRGRRDSKGSKVEQPLGSRGKDAYTLDGLTGSTDDAKVVNLEDNKYHFQAAGRRTRGKRQGRPINQDFIDFIKKRDFPSFGLDDLRNSASLVNPRLYASEVLHKVEIEVTETGTEAAAVTGALLERDGNQKRLVANRPFIFFIRHDPTRLVLFWATMNAPTPNYPSVT